ncbi:MAG: hypothetical protein EBZ78_07960 [Verrucomicrobia bacterium]|nr:hypothetical protein [Verrucomicrobiota bacterium]
MTATMTLGWTASELEDLRAIASDITLTWEEVAEALNARHPDRQPRSKQAIKLALRRNNCFIHRTSDNGIKLGRPAQKPPAAPGVPAELVAFVAALKREARLEVIRAVRATLDSLEALDAP